MTATLPNDNALRIVQVIPSYLPATRYGGPILSVHGLSKALVRLGHDVHVITTDIDGPGHSKVPLDTPVSLDGVTVTYYHSAPFRRLGWASGMRSGLRRALRRASVLHLNSVFMWPTLAAARTAERMHVPYLLAPRGALVPELFQKRNKLLKTAWLALFEAATVARAARLHVTSEAEYKDAQRLGLRVPPACLLPNGIDPPGPLADLEPTSDLAHTIAGGPYAVYLGRISWIKGLDRALRAIEGTEIRLLIAGNDEEGLRPTLEALAISLGVAKQISFVGYVEGADKWSLLRRARFLILPSYNENFGNVVAEGLSVGCPAIVTPEVGAAEVLQRSGGGLIASGEPAAFRSAMLQLWCDDAERDALGAAGQRYALEHLGWEAIARALVACYRSVIAESAARPAARPHPPSPRT